MLLLTLSVVGVAFNGFAKNIAQDVAVDTARFAALADQNSLLASERANRLLGRTLNSAFAATVQVSQSKSTGRCTYEVNVTLKPLAIGFLSGISTIKESALAVCELQR
jgi:hypothetical protein